jgi:acyl-CoA synthetase (AMP-forming)/AMP-acid ligase II
LGRDSGAINVGGSKVQPEVVERVILGHPNVVAAKVSGRRSSFLGNLVQAVLVVKDESDTPAFLEQIKSWCGERLQRHEIPAFFSVVNDLPIEGSGKLSRRPTDN